MGGAFIAFLISIFFVAVITRDSYAFVLFYLFAGAFIISRWWINRVTSGISYERKFEHRAFPGEVIPVSLVVRNTSWLPIIWLHAQESLPLEISNNKVLRKVFSISPRGQETLEYQLTPLKRGYYPLGPVQLSTGDLLGLVQEKLIVSEKDYLTVYPRVIPLSKIQIPSQSPLGDLRYEQPIFEDPSRPTGKRDYSAGDSLRRIDWKSTAVVGRLQTKLFEPSIALETVLMANLNSEEYHYKFRYDASELAIMTAASLANWIISKKQSVGLIVNGSDPYAADNRPQSFPARKGRTHLMRLLETLARVQLASVDPLNLVLRQKKVEFSWGTTIIVLTGQADEQLFDEFFQMRRSGLNLVLILCGDVIALQEAKARAKQFRIPFFHLKDEKDLDIWRR
jgi:uncharacterized protein (DUF58 family)